MLRTIFIIQVLFLFPGLLLAQRALPQEKVPGSVLLEVHSLSRTFAESLREDCPADVCFAKGCSYEEHHEIKMAESRGLPGLGATAAAQDDDQPQVFLTRARCEYAFEGQLPKAAVDAVSSR